MRLRFAIALPAALAVSRLAVAATFDDLRDDCTDPKKSFFQKTAGCVGDLFQLEPVKLAVHSFPPPGSIGFGARYTKVLNANAWDRSFQAGAAVSLRGFWYSEAVFTATRTPSPLAEHPLDEQFGFHLYGRYQDLKRLSYYGIGAQTARSNQSSYREQIANIGGDISQPLVNWLTVGGVAEAIVPTISKATGSTIPSIQTLFNDTTAPGMLQHPNMMKFGGFARFHHKAPVEFENRISYDAYQNLGTGSYSFQRFRAEAKHSIYPFKSEGRLRRDRVITIRGLFSTAHTGGANRVPFYLMETLGGRDLDGTATLRAFSDYRFRGPHLVLFQTEYAHRLWASKPKTTPDKTSLPSAAPHTLGLFTFYDVGQVALQRGDLSMARMRHSVGGGISIFVGGVLQAKIYVAVGGGEGSHTYTEIPKF
ncbi:MAG: hypothetical protein U0Q16_23090 [Bryobacteraceae bacterium]